MNENEKQEMNTIVVNRKQYAQLVEDRAKFGIEYLVMKYKLLACALASYETIDYEESAEEFKNELLRFIYGKEDTDGKQGFCPW